MKTKILGNAKLALFVSVFGVPVGATLLFGLYQIAKVIPWIQIIQFLFQ